jgi:hypothetical protein
VSAPQDPQQASVGHPAFLSFCQKQGRQEHREAITTKITSRQGSTHPRKITQTPKQTLHK